MSTMGRIPIPTMMLGDRPRRGRICVEGDGFASRAALDRMIRGRAVTCQPHGQDRYGRMLARCAVRGRDIGCAMVAAGQAVERYGRLNCAERGQ